MVSRQSVRITTSLMCYHQGTLLGQVKQITDDALGFEAPKATPITGSTPEAAALPIAESTESTVRLEWQGAPPLELRAKLDLSYHHQHNKENPVLGRRSAPAGLNWLVVAPASQTMLHHALAQLRKDQHIEICQNEDVESSDKFTGFSRLSFKPCALPELTFDDIDTRQDFLGATFAAPILITGMTGGIDRGQEINEALAYGADTLGIPMGVGSQRVALDNPDATAVFALKRKFPRLFLIGNLGASQLLTDQYLDHCQAAIDMIEADVLAIHINVLQESIQMEGDRHFKGIYTRLAELVRVSSVPIMIKEVGAGIDPASFRRLKDLGVAAIDIGGRGGTSWGYIEGLRSGDTLSQRLADDFRDWGIPTAYNIAAVAGDAEPIPIVATGGIRSGLTVAKAVALGATLTGVGLPLFRAALDSPEAVVDYGRYLIRGLRTAMMLTGSQSLQDLKPHLTWGQPYEPQQTPSS